MRRLPKGTVLGTVECPGCGSELPIKENKSGGVYYFCANVLERDEAGKAKEKCYTRFTFGREASNRIINEFLRQEENKNVEEFESGEEERAGDDNGTETPKERGGEDGDSRNPAPDIQQRAGGFAAGLKHFLIGDE